MDAIYTELKSWQGAIGSVLGFVALFLGALWNYHLNRRRDARLRQEEVASVAAALYGELILIRTAVARLSKSYATRYISIGVGKTRREIDAYFVDDHKLPEPTLYRALAAKVGMLPPEAVLAIARFHANASAAEVSLRRMIPDDKRGYVYSPLYVLEPGRDAVRDIAPTLRSLEKIAGLPPLDHATDLGDTDSVIDMERELLDH